MPAKPCLEIVGLVPKHPSWTRRKVPACAIKLNYWGWNNKTEGAWVAFGSLSGRGSLPWAHVQARESAVAQRSWRRRNFPFSTTGFVGPERLIKGSNIFSAEGWQRREMSLHFHYWASNGSQYFLILKVVFSPLVIRCRTSLWRIPKHRQFSHFQGKGRHKLYSALPVKPTEQVWFKSKGQLEKTLVVSRTLQFDGIFFKNSNSSYSNIMN